MDFVDGEQGFEEKEEEEEEEVVGIEGEAATVEAMWGETKRLIDE